MRTKTVKALFLSCVITLAAAAPAAAQGQLGAGLSFLHVEEETGTGFTLDYSRAFRDMEPGATLGYVLDFSLHNFGEFDTRQMSFMGGVRYGREANESLNWFAQGLIGFSRFSATEDCDGDGCSFTDFAIAPGFGVNVPISPSVNFRAQIDYMVIMTEEESTTGPRFWFGVSFPIGQSNP